MLAVRVRERRGMYMLVGGGVCMYFAGIVGGLCDSNDWVFIRVMKKCLPVETSHLHRSS